MAPVWYPGGRVLVFGTNESGGGAMSQLVRAKIVAVGHGDNFGVGLCRDADKIEQEFDLGMKVLAVAVGTHLRRYTNLGNATLTVFGTPIMGMIQSGTTVAVEPFLDLIGKKCKTHGAPLFRFGKDRDQQEQIAMVIINSLI